VGRALVVFESMFGNTEAVARAVGDGLAERMPVDVVPVSAAPDALPADVELLVVGGPTHAFGLSRASTRRSAVDQGAQPRGGVAVGLREWLAALALAGVAHRAVTFDTRVRVRGLPGSAARAVTRRLRSLGFDVDEHRTFWVQGTPGPLADGELDRARAWGVDLAVSRPGRAPTGVG
jgi:hypothetical protein